MRSHVWTWCPMALLAWAVMLTGSAAAQQLPQQFVAAYRPAAAAMKKAYAQGTVEGAVRRTNSLDGLTVNQRFLIRFVGKWFRCDETTSTQQGIISRTSPTNIILATPSVSLRCIQSNQLADVTNGSQWIPYNEAKAAIEVICPLSFPYSMGTEGTIVDMLRAGGTQLTAFKTGTQDGMPMIKIEYTQQVAPDGQYGPWDCSLLISPDEGYALREYTRTRTQGGSRLTIQGRLRYSVNLDGIPLLEHYTRKDVQGGRNSVTQQQTISISKFETTTPNKYFFRADGI